MWAATHPPPWLALIDQDMFTVEPAFQTVLASLNSGSVRPSWFNFIPSGTHPEFGEPPGAEGSNWSLPPTTPHGERMPAAPGAHHGAWPQSSMMVGDEDDPRYLYVRA